MCSSKNCVEDIGEKGIDDDVGVSFMFFLRNALVTGTMQLWIMLQLRPEEGAIAVNAKEC